MLLLEMKQFEVAKTDLEGTEVPESDPSQIADGVTMMELFGAASSSQQTEIQRYQALPPVILTKNSLQWWKNHDLLFPQLAKLAKVRSLFDVFSFPALSSNRLSQISSM